MQNTRRSKMKVKRVELMQLGNSFNAVSDLKGVKFAYAILKNKKIIANELEVLQTLAKPNPKFREYETKRVALCEEYCDKDEKGKPKVEKNNYVGLEENEKFKEELNKLQEEYKSVLDNQNKKREEYITLMQEEIEIDLYKVILDNLPEDITPKQLESIKLIVED